VDRPVRHAGQRDRGLGGAGVLDDVEQQLAHAVEQQADQLLGHRLGLPVVDDPRAQAVPLHALRHPRDRRGQVVLVQHVGPQVGHERAGVGDAFAEQLLNGLGLLRGRRSAPRRRLDGGDLHLADGEQLREVVVQLGGDALALADFGVRQLADERPQLPLVRRHRRRAVGDALLQRLVQRAELFFGALPFRHVLHQLREPDDAPRIVADDREDAVGEEALAVLADVPAHVGGAAVARGGRQLQLRHAGRAVFGREEDHGGTAEDLLFRVAQNALGAGVPTGDAALQIGREDRVVPDALDQQSILRLARAQPVFDAPRPQQRVHRRHQLDRLDRPHQVTFRAAVQPLSLVLAGDEAGREVQDRDARGRRV
jgi:hypothetical protein